MVDTFSDLFTESTGSGIPGVWHAFRLLAVELA
jgi:hypothetical protein